MPGVPQTARPAACEGRREGVTRSNIVKARFTGPGSRGQGAAKLARYMEERRVERDGQELYEKATTFGDRGDFVRAANDRAGQGRRSHYTHLVVSPERGHEFTDADFEKLLPSATMNRQGGSGSYFAAVHRDGNRPHMHVAVARDKYGKEELARLKEDINERVRERERVLDRRGGRDAGRGRERSASGEREDSRRRSAERLQRERERSQRERERRWRREIDREERSEDARYLYSLSHTRAEIDKHKGKARWKADHDERIEKVRADLRGRTGIPSFDEQRREGRLLGGEMNWSGEARRGAGALAMYGRHGLDAGRREVNRMLGRTPDVVQKRIGIWEGLTTPQRDLERIARQRREAAERQQERIYGMQRRYEALEREYAARERRVERARERVAPEREVGNERDR